MVRFYAVAAASLCVLSALIIGRAAGVTELVVVAPAAVPAVDVAQVTSVSTCATKVRACKEARGT
jgi:hypothetical protein